MSNVTLKHIISELKREVLAFASKDDWLEIKQKLDSLTTQEEKIDYIKERSKLIKRVSDVVESIEG